MGFDTHFLRSKIARRIFYIFICCSLLPIATLSFKSQSQVSTELNDQSSKRVRQWSKNVAMNILERLAFLENEMEIAALGIRSMGIPLVPGMGESSEEGTPRRFLAMFLIKQSGTSMPLFGFQKEAPLLTEEDMKVGGPASTTVVAKFEADVPPRVFMVHQIDENNREAGLLLGEIDTNYLWGIGDQVNLPPMTELCVVDGSRRVLASTVPSMEGLLEALPQNQGNFQTGVLEWNSGLDVYLTGYWTLFKEKEYGGLNWLICLSQSIGDARAPINEFKRTFPLAVILCFLVVLLLSHVYIRRSMHPLELLKTGTQRLAKGDFENRVEVASGDEFEELADSFNAMSAQLGKYFRALNTMAEIDRAILSSLETERIVATTLKGILSFMCCQDTAILLTDAKHPQMARRFSLSQAESPDISEEWVECPMAELRALLQGRESLLLDESSEFLPRLDCGVPREVKILLMVPIAVRGGLVGLVSVGFGERHQWQEDSVVQVKRLADQMAVALSNSALMKELEQMSWGTLQALARTVDAKSRWTAGHSERVADISLRIARELSFDRSTMSTLHKAALLHDIGKIGVSSAILDKKGRLTEEEWRIVKEHPSIGARILEPIGAYGEAIPLVYQHHERLDGSGYPLGLQGTDIVLGARVLAVADVFDALVSDRPYRDGSGLDEALETIREGGETLFDPVVVSALMKVYRIMA